MDAVNNENLVVPVDWVPSDKMIKVVGVGGGGVNAVTYMYQQNIKGCTFIVCNTDRQALEASEVPEKIQLGRGLGAGTNPDKGRKAALEAQKEFEEKIFGPETEMLFITAGMGGGTGTGASPVIAAMAKERGILTVAVVTLPFKSEQNQSMPRALQGIRELRQHVDSLLIINNEKLYEVYGDLLVRDAYPKTNEILATAVRGVIDIIMSKGYVNVDFEDVKNMMQNSGMALMGCGSATGKDRVEEAIKQALQSPLLNDYDLKTAKNTLINITGGRNDEGLIMSELSKIDDLIREYTGDANTFKRGIVYNDDADFKDRVNITVIATGFDINTLIPEDAKSNNIIEIDYDFEFQDDGADVGETELPAVSDGIKIGPDSTFNVCKFHFDERPDLAVEPGQNLGALENISAIRRHPAEDKQ